MPCRDCGNGVWECGEGKCGNGGSPVDWQVCGDAYLPTPIGLRYGVRVLAGIQEIGGEQKIRVRLIPKDVCVPTRACTDDETNSEKAANEPCPDDG